MQERMRILRGDLTQCAVDAVVNAANAELAGGGGVDGAIHRAAGPGLIDACAALGGCPTGSAKVTEGFGLLARWIIHAVGPRWRGGGQGEAELLASCYRTSLELAVGVGARTVAFPAISCGIYGYPLEAAAAIAVAEVRAFLDRDAALDRVDLVCFDEATLTAYRRASR